MKKENKWLGRVVKVISACWIFLLLAFLSYITIPSLLGGMVPEGASQASYGSARSISSGVFELQSMAQQILALVVFIMFLLVAVFSLVGTIMSIFEIFKAGNAGGWKGLWILVTLLLSGVGVLAYWHVGRKNLI